jgi:hypothetical protein
MRTDLQSVAETQRGRRTIGVGDEVKCRPIVGPSFVATVRRIMASTETGEIVEFEVVGGRAGVTEFRTFRPDRIEPLPKKRIRQEPAGS